MSLNKDAAEVTREKAMYGRLYASASGYVCLSVPNALARGVFDTLQEPGVELPPGHGDSGFNAHVTVMRPEEVAQIGGAEKITERGHAFPYTIGQLCTISKPAGWKEVSKVFALEVFSPALEKLRRSYGLPSLPTKDGKEFPLHLTCGVIRKNVRYENELSKHATLGEQLLARLSRAA